jgi:DNA-binding transcriptional MerR regulator
MTATAITYRIGEAAARAGVSCRTLRYYEELGLLEPSIGRAGGARCYSEEDVARLLRIREMQQLMGFNLDEIGSILGAEDRLSELREEFNAGARAGRRDEILAEAVELNNRLRSQVRAKLGRLEEFLSELEAKARRYREYRRKLADEPSR